MKNQNSNSTRLVKNTFFMYVRMAVLMCISLYTSRIVLKELGVEDFGIYNLVGSIVAIFASVRTIFSASTQRFLNYEMGSNNGQKLSDIFDTSMYINLFIAILFIISAEIVGLWFMNYEINIATTRLFAAQIVFQLSLFAAMVGIMTTSYYAVIIAHEKMDYYAYISILEGFLRLGIVFLLQVFNYDKLIVYGVLTALVSVVVLLSNYLYCRRYFSESRFTGFLNKEYFKKMIGFAGWSFFGVASYTITQNGLNIVLNIFGGPVVNAARGIAYQVNNVVNQIMGNIAIVINPYGTKLYACGDKDKFFQLFYFSSKTLFVIQLSVVLFIIFFTHDLLSLWLGDIPLYTEEFLKLVLITTVVRALHPAFDLIFKSSAQMKYYQLIEGIVLLMPLIVSYFGLQAGIPFYMVFVFIIFFETVNIFCLLILAWKKCGLSVKRYILKILLPCILFVSLAYLAFTIANNVSLISYKVIVFIMFTIACIAVYYLTLDSTEKLYINSVVRRKSIK